MSSQALAIGQRIPYSMTPIDDVNSSFIDKVTWRSETSNLKQEIAERIFKSINSNRERYEKKQVKRDLPQIKSFTSESISSIADIIHPSSNESSSERGQLNNWQQLPGSNQYQSSSKRYNQFLQIDNNYDYQEVANQDIYGLFGNVQQQQQRQQQRQPFVYNENLQPHQQPFPNRRFHYGNQQHKNKKPVYAPINQQTVNGILSLLLLFIISICGCIGTIFIMSALTVIESLQTRGNCYLVSLALSHLLVTLIVIPSSALQIMAGEGIDERRLCHYQWLVLEFSFIVSQLSFFLIAADNYLGYKSSEKIVTTADLLSASINGAATISNNLEVHNSLSSSNQMQTVQVANHPTSSQVDKRTLEADYSSNDNNSPNTAPGQLSKNTSPSINFPSELETSEFLLNHKQQGKVELRPPKSWISGLFPSFFGRRSWLDSPISLLISSSLSDQGQLDQSNERKLRLANKFAGAEPSKQSCFSYKNCCGRLRVIIWILLVWSIAFAYTLHQHELSYGPNFCTISSKHQIISINSLDKNNNSNNNLTQRPRQSVTMPLVVMPSNVRLKTRSNNGGEFANTYKIENQIDEQPREEPNVFENNQQHYLADKSKSSSNREGLAIHLNSSSQEISTQTQAPASAQILALTSANPPQRLATKAVRVGELTTASFKLDQTEIAHKNRFRSSGEYNNDDNENSIGQAIGNGRGKAAPLKEEVERRVEVSPNEHSSAGTFVPTSDRMKELLVKFRRSHSISENERLNFANSQMTSRGVDQVRTIETSLEAEPSRRRFKYGKKSVNGLRRDGSGSQLAKRTGNLHRDDNRSNTSDMDKQKANEDVRDRGKGNEKNDEKDRNDYGQNAVKETTHLLEPDLKGIWPTSSFTQPFDIRPNKAKFHKIRLLKRNVRAEIDTVLLNSSWPLMELVAQNKLNEVGYQADKATSTNLDADYGLRKGKLGYVYNDENNDVKEGDGKGIVKERKLRRANEIRVRETIQRSNFDSCHRNKRKGLAKSYVGKFGKLVGGREVEVEVEVEGEEKGKGNSKGKELNWLKGNSSWSLQLSSRSPISSGNNERIMSSCNKTTSIGDSSEIEVRSGDSNKLNHDNEKNGSSDDNCTDGDYKLESGWSQLDDRSNEKVGDHSGEKALERRPVKIQGGILTGSESSHDADNGHYMSATSSVTGSTTSLTEMPIHFTLVTSPRTGEFERLSTGLLNRDEFQDDKKVLLLYEDRERQLAQVRLKQLMVRHSTRDGFDRQNGQIDANSSAQEDDGDRAMGEVEDERNLESFYEGQNSNYAGDEFEDEVEDGRARENEQRGGIAKVGELKKVKDEDKRAKNGVKRKKSQQQGSLMNNNSGVSGMQIKFRFEPNARGLFLDKSARARESERAHRRLKRHYLDSNSNSISSSNPNANTNANQNPNLYLDPSSQSKSGLILIDDAVERQFNKRSLSSLDNSLTNTDVGPPLSSLQINELVFEPNNATSKSSLSPSANKNNNIINNVIPQQPIEASLDSNHNQANTNTNSLASGRLMINNSTLNNIPIKSHDENLSKTTSSNNNQQQRPKYYWFMLVGAIVVPNLASAILFARAYIKMKEFKTRTYRPIPLAAAKLSANLPAILMPNSPLPIPPQHQIYTFPSSESGAEKNGTDKVVYDHRNNNNKAATKDCEDDRRNYNQREEISVVSSDRKEDNKNNNKNNDDDDQHDEANNNEAQVSEITSSADSDEDSARAEQQIENSVFRGEQQIDGLNNLTRDHQQHDHKTAAMATTGPDYDLPGNNSTEEFYQNRRSLSQPNGTSSLQQTTACHYYQDHQKQQIFPQTNSFSPAPSLIGQAKIEQGQSHRQVNQVMSAPLGYDQYLFHHQFPIQAEQQRDWFPQQMQLQPPSEPPPGYLDGRPSPNGLNPNCYPNNQQEVFLINAKRVVELGNLNSITNGRDRGAISFSAPPSATFRQSDIYSSEEVFSSQTGANQNHCLSSDRELSQLSGSNDLRLQRPQLQQQQQQQHEPAYEFRRRRHHAQSFHYGSSSKPSQYSSVSPSNHGALLENEQQNRQQQLQHLAKIHQSCFLQPVHGSQTHNVQPMEKSLHQRSPVANSQQQQPQLQQHLLERHRSLPRSSRLHQSESGQPHLAAIGADAQITALPSEPHQRLPPRQQLWQQEQQQQQQSGRGFDEFSSAPAGAGSAAQVRPGYITNSRLTIDDPYSQSASHWLQTNGINNKQVKQRQRLNKQNSSETNKQPQQQHQHQHQSNNKTTQLTRTVTDQITTGAHYAQMEAVMLATPTTTPYTTVNSTVTNNTTNTSTTVAVTPAPTSDAASKQNQQAQLDFRSSKRSSLKQLNQTSEHLMKQEQQQQQPRQTPLKAAQSLSKIHSPELMNNKQTSNNGSQNKAILCTYSYMTDDQLLKSNIIVFILNLTLWLPFILLSIVIQYRQHLTQELKDSVWWMATLNCCSCSYVYALTNKDFREAFNKLFYYCCCKSHVTFQKKTPIFRRQLDIDSKGNLRIHIIPGLNIYSNKLLLSPVGTVGGTGTEIGSYHDENHNYHPRVIQPYDQQQKQQHNRRRTSSSHVSPSINVAQPLQSTSHRSSVYKSHHIAPGTGSECPQLHAPLKATTSYSGHDNQAPNYHSYSKSGERNVGYNSGSQAASVVL